MPNVIVDTDVVSFELKKDSRARRYRPHLVGRQGIISFMTLAELEEWAEGRRWGPARRERMQQRLARFIVYFADRSLCRLWGEVRAGAKRKGRPIDKADAWIAATALQLNLPLVTNNASDYAGVEGLTIVSEATA